MVESILAGMVVVLPLLALLLDWMGGPRIAERHHGHHDTYSISLALTRAVVFAMLFMSGMGVILSWLCQVGVFKAEPLIVLGFYAAFSAVCFSMWIMMRRRRAVTYETYMTVAPFIGRRVRVNYSDITGLTWINTWRSPTTRNVRVEVGGKTVAKLWGFLDIDEILMRVDRYDVLS